MGYWANVLGTLEPILRIGLNKAALDTSLITTPKTYQLPNIGGTLALVSQLPVASPGIKTLGYTDGILTNVNGPGAATKTLTYTGGVLTQVQGVSAGVTITKTLAYTNGSLTSVATVIT
jgi:hypothetical protein